MTQPVPATLNPTNTRRAILNARYRDIQYLVGVLLNVGFFAVPIVYTPDLLRAEPVPDVIRILVEWNPMALFIEIARHAVYFLDMPAWNRLLASLLWAIATFSFGLYHFRIRSMDISEEP